MITRKSWYENISIQYEIVRQLINRETFLLPFNNEMKPTRPIRWLKIHCRDFMWKNFNKYNFLKYPMNLYNSMAIYHNMPMFSFNWQDKSQEQQLWSKNYHNYITGIDLFLETDSKDLSKSLADARGIINVLDRFNIKYFSEFSGSKGFHVIVPYEEFVHLCLKPFEKKKTRLSTQFTKFLQRLPVPISEIKEHFDLVLLYKVINSRIAGIYALDTVDTSISDVLRVHKTAYSIDVKSGLVALPLDNEQLNNFSKSIVEPENVLRSGIYKRGLLYRNSEVCRHKRRRGIIDLIVELGIVKE